ncbi:MAG: hypothetical protein JSR91_02205 [Proteobacteria bacterium]|nr:hypothetical protein [Pseudomonadota bacterium]
MEQGVLDNLGTDRLLEPAGAPAGATACIEKASRSASGIGAAMSLIFSIASAGRLAASRKVMNCIVSAGSNAVGIRARASP